MKEDTQAQLHVTFMRPMRIKLGDRSTAVVAFDGTLDEAVSDTIVRYKTDRIYAVVNGVLNDGGISLKTSLIVPRHNIAGIVAQPFLKKE